MSREYYNQPRPEIEYHYHIKDLIEGQEKRANDRNYHRAQAKTRAEREELIRDNRQVEKVSFWCEKCKEDFEGIAQKQEEMDWANENQQIAFYKTKCFKNHWVMRFITDKHSDPYWFRSRFVRKDRENHTADLLQPFEEGYQLLFGRKNI